MDLPPLAPMNDGTIKQLDDLRYALDQAAIVATTDVRGRITYVNDKFCEISGYSKEELLGEDHRILNSGLHSGAFMRNLWRTIANGQVWHGEMRNKAKDGHFYWVYTTIVPFLDERGRPYQYTAIRSDITARKAAEERLREQAALAQVGQMAAVVAHEVKNPLAGIKGVMQVLMSRRRPGDGEFDVMTDVVDRIDALNELIQDLLLFARPRPLRLEMCNMRTLVLSSLEAVHRDPLAARVRTEVDVPPIAIHGDPELLRAVLLNLMLNAVQAMNGTGRLRVRGQQVDGRCVLDIADTGPGIPPAIRDRIFEPFFTTRSRGGGLGLPIARRTVDLHGGTLAISCPDQGGTVIQMTLPIEPPVTRSETLETCGEGPRTEP